MRDREVIFGKLAIGRRLLERGDAVDCFHRASAAKPLWAVAVEAGLLSPGQAKTVLDTIENGELVCRSCQGRFRLADLTAAGSERCGSCGGQLFLARGRPAPDFDQKAETWRDPSLGAEVAAARDAVPPAVAPPVSPMEDSLPEPVPPKPAARVIPPTRTSIKDGEPVARVIPETRASIKEGESTAEHLPEGFEPFTINGIQVLAPIGKGGMGSVFKAKQPMGRVVALKLLEIEDKDQRARFARESRAIAKLDHPNIVKVFVAGEVKDEGPHQGKPFFAMDYVDGRDLVAWAHERPRSAKDCALMVATLCDAMDYTHGKAIIHRDLKPQNVLVARDGDVPKICDFGLAQVKAESAQLTRTGDVMGTPQYMPPEQAIGDRKKIGPPTDVYALGAILYELLVGRPPFVSARLHALIAMVVRDKPQPPSKIAPERNTPPALEEAVLKALEKEPTKRFHTAGEMGQALRAAVYGEES
jgi:predicted Ser/Thr protein kinase